MASEPEDPRAAQVLARARSRIGVIANTKEIVHGGIAEIALRAVSVMESGMETAFLLGYAAGYDDGVEDTISRREEHTG